MGDATGLRRDLNRGRAHPEVCGGAGGDLLNELGGRELREAGEEIKGAS